MSAPQTEEPEVLPPVLEKVREALADIYDVNGDHELLWIDEEASQVEAALEDLDCSDLIPKIYISDQVLEGDADDDDDELLGTLTIIEAGRPQSAKERYTALQKTMADPLNLAIPTAADAMRNLNRYASRMERRTDGARLVRNQIHLLKREFVEALFRRGLCTGAWIHEQEVERRYSYWELMDEFDDDEFDDDFEEDEEEREPEIDRFVGFRFEIQLETYVWRLPEAQVRFDRSSAPKLRDTRTALDAPRPTTSSPTFDLTAALDVVQYVVAALKPDEVDEPEPEELQCSEPPEPDIVRMVTC